MTNFFVGQRVVCIDDAPRQSGCMWWPGEQIHRDRIYTVARLFVDFENEPVVSLLEVTRCGPLTRSHPGRIGYAIFRFRPLVTKQTNIEVFTAMLNPKKQEIEA